MLPPPSRSSVSLSVASSYLGLPAREPMVSRFHTMPPLILSVMPSARSAISASFDPAAHSTILAAHAEGAQIYECKAGASGALTWTFREPIASLIVDGKTIGRHHAGPHWALADGSIDQGKLAATVPGATATDIPLLKLEVVAHERAGALHQATLVYRVGTHGGVLSGPCSILGSFRSISYTADYLFEK
jgi:hypothetical protein